MVLFGFSVALFSFLLVVLVFLFSFSVVTAISSDISTFAIMLSIIPAITAITIIIELAVAIQPFWHKPSVKHLGCTAIGDAVLGVMRVPLYFRFGDCLTKKPTTTVGQSWPSRRRGGLTHSGASCAKKKPLPLARRKALPLATRGKHEATRGKHRAVQSRKGVARTATEVI